MPKNKNSIAKCTWQGIAFMEVLMKKDDVLELSRKENRGKLDEREMAAIGTASRVGMLVGGILCAVLVFLSEFLFKVDEIGVVAWLVYFAMQGSHHIALYTKLKGNKHLVYNYEKNCLFINPTANSQVYRIITLRKPI
jgi:hypothetical protein